MAAIPKHIESGTGDVQGLTGKKVLMGWSARESAAVEGAATISLYNGTSTSDPKVAVIELAASRSETTWLEEGVVCSGGVFIERGLGTAEIVLYYH